MNEYDNMTFFSCSCFLDFVIVLKSKFNISDFIVLSEQNGAIRPKILLVDSTWYLYYPVDFYEKCMENCIREFLDPESVNCLDLLEFEDLCDSCHEVTISNLLKCLINI